MSIMKAAQREAMEYRLRAEKAERAERNLAAEVARLQARLEQAERELASLR